jgi:hypothetical protein
MLEKLLPRFLQELKVERNLSSGVPGAYILPLGDVHINMTEIPPSGFIMKCSLAPYPKVNEGDFSSNAMLANLFGQGTRGAILGLTPEGNTLTLTRIIDYQVDYKEFKEILEDFISAVDFWRDEALNHK